ncbi:MAG: hypothetical protein ACJA0Q_000760 [Saprospiraceae bacterium]|jgi:hypothetical protein
MTKHLNYLLGIVIFTVLISSQTSCKKEKTTWDTKLKAPLAQTELKIDNLLSTEGIETNADSSLKIVFENDLANISLTDFFKLPEETIEFGSSLQTLRLDDDSTVVTLTLGELGRAAGYGPTLAAFQAAAIPLGIPALSGFPDTELNIDNSALFQTIDVKTGSIVVTIENNLPVDMNDLQIDLNNSPGTGGALLGTTTFLLIAANTTVSNIVPLDGKTVSSQLVATLSNYNTSASAGSVPIDTTDALIATVATKDIIPNSATAIWPDQNLIDSTSLAFLAQSNGAMIKKMIVNKGAIDIDVFSSLQDSMFIAYSIPNLTKGGISFIAEVGLPPAPVGGFSSKSVTINFDGYDFILNGYGIESTFGSDLNGNATIGEPDTVNTYVQILTARMKYTGVMVPISLSDTVYIKASIGNITPSSVEGYMGRDTVEIGPSTASLDLFNNHLSGKLKLEDAKLEIVVDNGVGAQAKLKIESLSGTSTVNNSTVNLSGTGVTSVHNLGAATETGGNPPVLFKSTSVPLTNINSNAADFLGNLPNSISYSLKAMLNGHLDPLDSSDVPSYKDVVNKNPKFFNFLYDGYGLNAKINIEIPLSLAADNLTLVDTLDFIYTEKSTDFTQSVFTLIVENGFGFDATINLILLDANGTSLDSLLSEAFVTRGNVDPATGKTTSRTKSFINFKVGADKVALLKNSEKIKAVIKLHSHDDLNDSNLKFHKIYSSDSFKLQLIGSAIYNMQH